MAHSAALRRRLPSRCARTIGCGDGYGMGDDGKPGRRWVPRVGSALPCFARCNEGCRHGDRRRGACGCAIFITVPQQPPMVQCHNGKLSLLQSCSSVIANLYVLAAVSRSACMPIGSSSRSRRKFWMGIQIDFKILK
eukprot:SAG11_NODE_134_length_15338_cov_3.876435_9_plen_137_part_00